MRGEVAIRARAVIVARARQGNYRVVYVSLIFCKQGQSNVLVYILLGSSKHCWGLGYFCKYCTKCQNNDNGRCNYFVVVVPNALF